MAPTIGYWDIRGLAEPIRYLLSYKNVDFEDKRYEFNTDSWTEDKFNLGLDFPNLPYLIDGDVRLTQSVAILRYLAKRYSLYGNTEEEKLRVLVAEQQLIDLRSGIIDTCYSSNFDVEKAAFVQRIPDQLKLWSTFLGDAKFLIGKNLTYVDFIAYDVFDFCELLSPAASFKNFPTLKAYLKRIEKLPELQRHFKSSTYKRWPIFSPRAAFGGTGDEPPKN